MNKHKEEEYQLGTLEDLENAEVVYQNGFNLGYESAKNLYKEMLSDAEYIQFDKAFIAPVGDGPKWYIEDRPEQYDSALLAYKALHSEAPPESLGCTCTNECFISCRGGCGCRLCLNDYNDFLSVE